MKIAVTADLHFHNFSEFGSTVVEPHNGLPVNSRLLDQLTNFMNLAKSAKLQGCTHLMINGDVFHIRGSVPTDVYQLVYMLFDTVVNILGIPITIMTGNHDQSDKSGKIHSVYGLRKLCRIVDKPEVVKLGGATVYCIPYMSDKKLLVKAMDWTFDSDTHCDLLMAHCGVDGATVGPIEYRIKDPVTMETLHPEMYNWVLLGHYHAPQQLAPNVLYVGSPAQINRGERFETKRWVMYDSDNPKKLKSIKTGAKEFGILTAQEFVETPTSDLQGYYDVLMSPDADANTVMSKSNGMRVKIIPAKREVEDKTRLSLAEEMTDAELLTAYAKYVGNPVMSSPANLSLGLQLLQRGSHDIQNITRLALMRVIVNNFLVIQHADLVLHRPGSVIAVLADNQGTAGFTSNGGGKSSLVPESIFWCLWGVTARDVPADKVVNNKLKRNCSVQLILYVGNTKLDVTRYRKHKELGGDGLRLIVDGKDVTEGTPKLTQVRLDKELGVDYLTFSSVLAFSPDNLRFVTDTDLHQKQVLDAILQTRRFGNALEVTRKAMSVTRASRLSASQALDASDTTLENLKELATTYAERNVTWEQRESDRVYALQGSLEVEQDAIKITEVAIQTAKEQIADNTRAIAKYTALKEALPEYEEPLLGYMTQLATGQALASSLGGQLKQIENNLEAAVEQAGKPCPTCGQAVANTGKLIAGYQAQAQKLRKDIAHHNNTNTQLNEAKKGLEDTRTVDRAYTHELQTLSQQKTGLENKLNGLQSQLVRQNDRVKRFKQQIADKPVNEYDLLLPEVNGKIETETATRQIHAKDVMRADKTMAKLEFWNTAFGGSGVRSFLLDQMLPALTRYSNEFSDELSGGSIQIGFKTHKDGVATDKFVVQAWNEEGADLYKGNSSGEKRRIDVCIMLGLFRIAYNRTRFNVLSLDETLDTLDEAGLENVVGVLEKLALELKLTIFVTSHTDLNQRLHESITIKKRGGVSNLM